MTAASAALLKPQPAAPKTEPLSVQITIRLTATSRERIRKLAEAEGLTIQQVGVYAWSLALQAYGEKPLPEAGC